MVQDNPTGTVSRSVMDTLRARFHEIWKKIMAAPNSYVMKRLEYAVFNLFSAEIPDARIGERARRRYWDNAGRAD